MKRILFLIIAVIYCHIAYSQQIISFSEGNRQSTIGDEKDLRMPTTSLSLVGSDAIIIHQFSNAAIREVSINQKKYATIHIEGYGYESELGKPQVPGYTDIIPLNNDNTSLQISPSNYVEYPNMNIVPAQQQSVDKITPDSIYVFDNSVYSKNEFFPQELVRIQGIQDYRGQKYAFVRVNPVQYNPVTGVIRCYQEIQYHLTNLNFNALKKHTRNLDDPPQITSRQEKYIIVTSNSYLSSIDNFVKWKENLGYHVSVLSKDQWTNDVEVRDSIRTEFYRDTTLYSPKFLLIIGDYSAVPAPIIWSNDIFDEPHYLTDHFFACMGDSTDCVEDISRGRIPLINTDSVTSFLQFIIQKEKNPSFYKKGIHCAYFDSKNGTMEHLNCVCFSEETRDYMMRHNFQIDRVYKKKSSANPLRYNTTYANGDSVPEELRVGNFAWNGTANDITNAFYDGCDYIMYKGHGTKEGLYNIGFNRTSLLHIDNNICTPIFFCFACQCGQYAYIDNSGQVSTDGCFAVSLMQRKKSCGIVASSGNSNTPFLEPFGEAMFSSMYLDSLLLPELAWGHLFSYFPLQELNDKSRTEIGEMMRFGHIKMLQSYGLSQGAIKETTHMHVFGDPSYHFPICAPHELDSIDVYRLNDSICINLNGISPCTILLIKEDDSGEIQTYKRIEDISENYIFHDTTNYNKIIIKKNNSTPVVLNQIKNIYLQNKNIYSKEEYWGENVWAGRNVTNTIPTGDVVVKNGGSLKLTHSDKTILEKGFKVELGGKLSVKQQ